MTTINKINISNPTTIAFDSETNKPNFFKIIFSSNQPNLRFPVEFVKNYGRYLSDEIYLNVPNSEQPWKMELEKDNNYMYLVKGWQVFMDFYGLRYGHFLVLRFDGGLKSQFHVLIFNATATEIDYPVRNSCLLKGGIDSREQPKNAEEDQTEEQEAEDVSSEMLDEFLSEQNKIESVIVLNSSDSDSDSDEDDDVVQCSSHNRKGYNVLTTGLRKKQKNKLEGIRSQHPHFKSVMCPSHVYFNCSLSVPFKHASVHFPKDNSKKIILKGPSRKSYPVSFYIGKRTAQLLSSGWRSFVFDNQLKVGDTCLFELVKRKTNTYEVSIFRR